MKNNKQCNLKYNTTKGFANYLKEKNQGDRLADVEEETKTEVHEVFVDDSYDYYDVEESFEGYYYLVNEVDNHYCYEKKDLIMATFKDRELAEKVADLLNENHGIGYKDRR